MTPEAQPSLAARYEYYGWGLSELAQRTLKLMLSYRGAHSDDWDLPVSHSAVSKWRKVPGQRVKGNLRDGFRELRRHGFLKHTGSAGSDRMTERLFSLVASRTGTASANA